MKFFLNIFLAVSLIFVGQFSNADMPNCYEGICLNAVVTPEEISNRQLEFKQRHYCEFVGEFSRGKPNFDEFMVQVFLENYNIVTSNDIIRIPKGTVIRIERNLSYLHTAPLTEGLSRSQLQEWDRNAYDAAGVVLDRVRDAVIKKYGQPTTKHMRDTLFVYGDNRQLEFKEWGSRQSGQYLVLFEEIWRTGLDSLYAQGVACTRDQEREEAKELIPD